MTPVRRVKTVRIDDDLLDAMARLHARDGIPESEQIRRALRPWLAAKGVLKSERQRESPRTRSAKGA